ncbi:MAG: hypothetical protein AMS16_04405 [Planctomycetes bacterium DG_58]|nr:MAG: hypothetical protein AMS16_04405 [Planctomycetes bacterium DG_58]
MRAFVWTIAVLFLISAWASADVIVIDFTESGSKANAIFWTQPNSNTGGETAQKAGIGRYHDYRAVLYSFELDCAPGLLGGTVNSATFSVRDSWGGMTLNDVEIVRIDTPTTWEVGNGTWGTRWNWHSGAGKFYPDLDPRDDWQGVNWGSSDFTTAIGAVIDNQDGFGGGATTTWDVKTLVANWADGSWSNKGFAIWMGNADNITMDTGIINLVNPTLTINYEPIPEPATMLFVGTGVVAALGWLRRRRMK